MKLYRIVVETLPQTYVSPTKKKKFAPAITFIVMASDQETAKEMGREEAEDSGHKISNVTVSEYERNIVQVFAA